MRDVPNDTITPPLSLFETNSLSCHIDCQLRLETLALLPISYRRFATPAANGSIQDLDRLLRLLGEIPRDKLKERLEHCLPVLYSNLDPADIVTEGPLPADAPSRAIMVPKALHHHIQVLGKEHPINGDIWPRLWAWLHYFHTHPDHLPDGLDVGYAGSELLSFCNWFSKDRNTDMLIQSTEGVAGVAMDVWVSLNDSSVDESITPAMNSLTQFLASMHIDGAKLLEILDALGGPTKFASLAVQTLNKTLSEDISQERFTALDRHLTFLHTVEESGDKENRTPTRTSVALAAAGAAASFTSVARAIGTTVWRERRQDAPPLLLACFELLREVISGPRAMCEALNAGLLESLITCAGIVGNPGERSWTSLGSILALLTTSTVYRTVTSGLAVHLPAAEPLVDSPKYQASNFSDAWGHLIVVAHRRIAVMREMESQSWQSSKACDNVDCGVIRARATFKRCSACLSVYYCSVECQKVDWNERGHRIACNFIRTCAFSPNNISRRNHSFMREVMHKDITEHAYDESPPMSLARLAFLRENNSTYGEQDIPWDDYIRRASRSAGRMELHVMIIREDVQLTPNTRVFVFPQRSDRPSFHAGLSRVLGEPEGAHTLEEVHELRAADENVVRIH
ncbi:hypothetical protein C8R46DRAFT_1356106 [Mycena filopes]|nr:hypothetical protein C8R46DRAFT_1356106 [Mycena filopes]